jgi:hypothetical protein
MKRAGAAIAAIVVVMSVVLVAAAAAHKVRFDTSATIKYDKPAKNDPYAKAAFKGNLTSAKARCEKNRTVSVYRREANGSETVIGSDATDVTGAWGMEPGSVAPGTYFAHTAKKVLRKNKKHRHICRAGTSRDLKVK